MSERERLIEGLRYTTEWRSGQLIAPSVYAPGRRRDMRTADITVWYLTGPKERLGYTSGAFDATLIKQMACAGELEALAFDQCGRPCLYRLAALSQQERK